jgi:hypothetical protein
LIILFAVQMAIYFEKGYLTTLKNPIDVTEEKRYFKGFLGGKKYDLCIYSQSSNLPDVI